MTTFAREVDFENAVIHELTQRGWESEVIKKSRRKRFAG